jgi:hypothetical protein
VAIACSRPLESGCPWGAGHPRMWSQAGTSATGDAVSQLTEGQRASVWTVGVASTVLVSRPACSRRRRQRMGTLAHYDRWPPFITLKFLHTRLRGASGWAFRGRGFARLEVGGLWAGPRLEGQGASPIGPGGFEPPLTDPKSAVLPLDEGPVGVKPSGGAIGAKGTARASEPLPWPADSAQI